MALLTDSFHLVPEIESVLPSEWDQPHIKLLPHQRQHLPDHPDHPEAKVISPYGFLSTNFIVLKKPNRLFHRYGTGPI